MRAGARYEMPKVAWVAWCQRCGEFVAASGLRRMALTDCPYCPPNTPTEAVQFVPRTAAKKRPR